MQTSTEPKAATLPPQQPPSPVSITTVGADGKTQTLTIPATRSEVDALLVRRQELSEQLTSVTSRRRDLSEELRSAPDGASRAGLEQRIGVLDQRILQLEADLAITGRQVASARPELVASTESRRTGGDDVAEIMMTIGFPVLFFSILAFLYGRRRRRRRVAPRPDQLPVESATRLERLEQGMEAIAIEIERISEGQRFVTKLLSESQEPVGASHRIAQPAAVERQDPARR
jgi:hypothetical protein